MLYPDGHQERIGGMPTFAAMRTMVGGYVEQVRVLDRVDQGKFVYTYMYVNEEGLIRGVPRNEVATALYQCNVRTAFAGQAEPFQAAKQQARQTAEAQGFTVIDQATPAGYEDDPYIAGVAVYFQGFTCQEINRWYDTHD